MATQSETITILMLGAQGVGKISITKKYFDIDFVEE